MPYGPDDTSPNLADCLGRFDSLIASLDRLAEGRPREEAYPIKMAALRAVQIRDMLGAIEERSEDPSLGVSSQDSLDARSEIVSLKRQIEKALCEVAANIIRMVRGTGRPELAIDQIRSLAGLFGLHERVAGKDLLAGEIERFLSLDNVTECSAGSCDEWDLAVLDVVRGALQIAASELVGQHTLSAAGRAQVFGGNRDLERLHRRELDRILRR